MYDLVEFIGPIGPRGGMVLLERSKPSRWMRVRAYRIVVFFPNTVPVAHDLRGAIGAVKIARAVAAEMKAGQTPDVELVSQETLAW